MSRQPRAGRKGWRPLWLISGLIILVAVVAQTTDRAPAASSVPLIDRPALAPAEFLAVRVEEGSPFCQYWVAPAPAGNDNNQGTRARPWATMTHAVDSVPDLGCVVWFADGVYMGGQEADRRFTRTTVFKAEHAYRATFENNSVVLDIDGGRNMAFEGFEFRHSGPGATDYVVIVDQGDGLWAEKITFRNNIFHDSYDNDLLKIHNGVRMATVEHNLFYNQGPSEQHIDVNSVTDVVVKGNIFFNDFTRSNRTDPGNTKHYIVVKDSNEGDDGLLGSERITIRRNVFLNWEGGTENFVKIGNDGKPYHEAKDVVVENNLMIGNSSDSMHAAFGVDGARNVLFANNTVVGNLPSDSFAFRVGIKGDNPRNENIVFANNIWSDPTGTMGAQPGDPEGDFGKGDLAETNGFTLDNNLYWNGGIRIPPGSPIDPLSGDSHRVVGDPLLNTDQRDVVVPYWNGSSFLSGSTSILSEFTRLVETYGSIGPGSPAVDRADAGLAPSTDILGRLRGASPDLGAYERGTSAGLDTPACPKTLIPDGGFSDLAGLSTEAVDAVNCLAFRGIARGLNSSTFAPNFLVPRWQMALFLTRQVAVGGVPLPSGSDQGFGDIAQLDAEAITAINQLAQLGITTGTSPTTFNPGSNVPRWQMALFLTRMLETVGEPLPVGPNQVFGDIAHLDPEAITAINQLAQLGITTGTSPTTFNPGSNVPRWQMALFLARSLQAAVGQAAGRRPIEVITL